MVQLVTLFPRPPLSTRDDAFVLAQLVGNPIGTLKGLLLKFSVCQMRHKFWIDRFSKNSSVPATWNDGVERRCKAFAIIVHSYDEWGHLEGQKVQDYLIRLWQVVLDGYKQIEEY